jgi:hypothetical protein
MAKIPPLLQVGYPVAPLAILLTSLLLLLPPPPSPPPSPPRLQEYTIKLWADLNKAGSPLGATLKQMGGAVR